MFMGSLQAKGKTTERGGGGGGGGSGQEDSLENKLKIRTDPKCLLLFNWKLQYLVPKRERLN